ncbi:uncharacterized protein [Palaemon carinicauda]|uniref:uncharacterized protein n=1 Tax=Palaemon carinicauda TaxID=392227 RepID=UPI0035B5A486
MNGYQRMEMEIRPIMYIQGVTCCEDSEHCQLPEEMLAAVSECNTEKLLDHLKKGFDINAQFNGETLLWRACSVGQTEVLSMLLESPDVHLNIVFDGKTPLARASSSGYIECVRMILNAQLKCRVRLDSGWKAITKIIKEDLPLNQDSLVWILQWAGYCGQWEVVLLIIQAKTYLPGEILYRVLLKAVSEDRWDVVSETAKRKFSNKVDIMDEILFLCVKYRKWDTAEDILQAIDGSLKLHVTLVEAALNCLEDQVRLLLTERRCEESTLNGCLLAVAAGGTNEEIARLITGVRGVYTSTSYSNALVLASMGQNSEMFSALLSSPETDYSFHDLCRAHKALEKCSCCDFKNFIDPFVESIDRLKEKIIKAKNLLSRTISRTPQSYYKEKSSRRITPFYFKT